MLHLRIGQFQDVLLCTAKGKKCLDYGLWWRHQRAGCSWTVLGQISALYRWQKRKNGLSGPDHFWKFLYLFVEKTVIEYNFVLRMPVTALCCIWRHMFIQSSKQMHYRHRDCGHSVTDILEIFPMQMNEDYLVSYNPLSKHILLDIDYPIENATVTQHHNPPRPPS